MELSKRRLRRTLAEKYRADLRFHDDLGITSGRNPLPIRESENVQADNKQHQAQDERKAN